MSERDQIVEYLERAAARWAEAAAREPNLTNEAIAKILKLEASKIKYGTHLLIDTPVDPFRPFDETPQ